jgi:hypothetical protein
MASMSFDHGLIDIARVQEDVLRLNIPSFGGSYAKHVTV